MSLVVPEAADPEAEGIVVEPAADVPMGSEQAEIPVPIAANASAPRSSRDLIKAVPYLRFTKAGWHPG